MYEGEEGMMQSGERDSGVRGRERGGLLSAREKDCKVPRRGRIRRTKRLKEVTEIT